MIGKSNVANNQCVPSSSLAGDFPQYSLYDQPVLKIALTKKSQAPKSSRKNRPPLNTSIRPVGSFFNRKLDRKIFVFLMCYCQISRTIRMFGSYSGLD